MSRVSRAGVSAAYRDGVMVICELAAQLTDASWLAATPCTEWRTRERPGAGLAPDISAGRVRELRAAGSKTGAAPE